MTDIEVLEREKQCVQRKAATNCSDCAHCDLLMDEAVILAAYDRAISALRVRLAMEKKYYQCENCGFWCESDPRCMCEDSQWAGCTVKKDNYCGRFLPRKEREVPLTMDELREMGEEPVWYENLAEPHCSEYKVIKLYGEHLEFISWTDGTHDLLENYGKTWLAYRRKPEEANT